MAQMTPSTARVIDPILSTVAQGYQNAALIGSSLFPVVTVEQRGGKIVTFGKEDFMQYSGLARAPGGDTQRIQFSYGSTSYALEQFAIEGQVPFELMEDAQAVPGIDLGRLAVQKVQSIIALRLEIAQAGIATTAGSYAAANKTTLSGTAQWSDQTTGASHPVSAIETAKDAIRAATGKRANVIVMGAAVMAKLRTHPDVIDRIKYTGRDVATPELLASLFGVQQVLTGDAITATDAGVFSDVWGKFVIVAFTEIAGIAQMGLPSYGYTYRLRGNPTVEMAYQDRGSKSWIYPVTDELSPVMAAPSAGYLISAAVA